MTAMGHDYEPEMRLTQNNNNQCILCRNHYSHYGYVKIGKNSQYVKKYDLLSSIIHELRVRPNKPLCAIAYEYYVKEHILYDILKHNGLTVNEIRDPNSTQEF